MQPYRNVNLLEHGDPFAGGRQCDLLWRRDDDSTCRVAARCATRIRAIPRGPRAHSASSHDGVQPAAPRGRRPASGTCCEMVSWVSPVPGGMSITRTSSGSHATWRSNCSSAFMTWPRARSPVHSHSLPWTAPRAGAVSGARSVFGPRASAVPSGRARRQARPRRPGIPSTSPEGRSCAVGAGGRLMAAGTTGVCGVGRRQRSDEDAVVEPRVGPTSYRPSARAWPRAASCAAPMGQRDLRPAARRRAAAWPAPAPG